MLDRRLTSSKQQYNKLGEVAKILNNLTKFNYNPHLKKDQS